MNHAKNFTNRSRFGEGEMTLVSSFKAGLWEDLQKTTDNGASAGSTNTANAIASILNHTRTRSLNSGAVKWKSPKFKRGIRAPRILDKTGAHLCHYWLTQRAPSNATAPMTGASSKTFSNPPLATRCYDKSLLPTPTNIKPTAQPRQKNHLQSPHFTYLNAQSRR